MKLFIVLAAVALAQAAKLDRTYLPPNAQASSGSAFLDAPRQSNGFQSQTGAFSSSAQSGAYSGFEARPVERAQAAFERNAAILRQDNSNDGETYAYAYETENGISGEENGVATNGVQAQGSYSYTGDDGKVYSVRYTADENGFQPQGDHLPTPHPIPEEILKALEQNARDEAAGIFDDGSYSEAKYDSNSQQTYYDSNAQAINFNKADAVVTNSAGLRNDAHFVQRNNQRGGVQQIAFNSNSRAAQSSSSAAGVQKTYLPPFAQKAGSRQSSFDARAGYRY
ncbi:cuticle protein 3-like [Spodoptera litura]|uniref:Cuticle protein 3-like n=1 Tax=Spodoptera litura TaxID=69820 RepID=A0A4U7BHF3_SPOLT|nr:cuticle protein 3-like [Spodoptera litura]TKX27717.1 cuticular protein RR-1 [Spodoptera litura]